ncbi:MAG: hypothetical protein KUG78_19295 [Kangiellaceae bacterium]|nr:hypothetical protein [Kangiellaceae bacterium]
MKVLIYFLIPLTFLFSKYVCAKDSSDSNALNDIQQEQIKLLRTELEFLASKLLRITSQKEFSLRHSGHTLVHFGVCGKGTTQGFKVKCVTPHTAAYKIGIKTGDILIKINQLKLAGLEPQLTSDKYSTFLKELKDGDKVIVTYSHNGVVKTGESTIVSILAPGYEFSVSNKIAK